MQSDANITRLDVAAAAAGAARVLPSVLPLLLLLTGAQCGACAHA
jgi:hypothetical protein